MMYDLRQGVRASSSLSTWFSRSSTIANWMVAFSGYEGHFSSDRVLILSVPPRHESDCAAAKAMYQPRAVGRRRWPGLIAAPEAERGELPIDISAGPQSAVVARQDPALCQIAEILFRGAGASGGCRCCSNKRGRASAQAVAQTRTAADRDGTVLPPVWRYSTYPGLGRLYCADTPRPPSQFYTVNSSGRALHQQNARDRPLKQNRPRRVGNE